MSVAGAVARGVLLGLGAAVPIGPVNVEIARRTLRAGFRAGAALGVGAVTVDMAYAVLVSLGVGRWVAESRGVRVGVGVAGVIVLGWLAWGCFRGAWAAVKDRDEEGRGRDAPATGEGGALRGYGQGVVMTATNPMTLAFWFVVLPGVVGEGALRGEMGWVAAGVGVGAVSWVAGFAGVLSVAGRWKKGAWVVAADLVGGVILVGFAIVAGWRAMREF